MVIAGVFAAERAARSEVFIGCSAGTASVGSGTTGAVAATSPTGTAGGFDVRSEVDGRANALAGRLVAAALGLAGTLSVRAVIRLAALDACLVGPADAAVESALAASVFGVSAEAALAAPRPARDRPRANPAAPTQRLTLTMPPPT